MKMQGIATRYGIGANAAPILSNESKSGQRFKSKFQLFKDRRITSVRKFHKGRKINLGIEFSEKFINNVSKEIGTLSNTRLKAEAIKEQNKLKKDIRDYQQKKQADKYIFKRLLKQGKVLDWEDYLESKIYH